jgi:hypothetical protein
MRNTTMAIGVYFAPTGMSTERYGEILKQLEAAGAGSPKGRSYHSAFGEPTGLHVYDVWDSQADFDAFGVTLMPIMAKIGVDPGQPQIAPIHNIIKG